MDSLSKQEPGGLVIVNEWLGELFGGPGSSLWAALDDRLRLTLAQGWILSDGREPDDDLAEDLAADDSTHPYFEAMLSDLRTHWRQVYSDLEKGSGVWRECNLVGADLELVVLASPDCIGHYPKGGQILAHCFITRLGADAWYIAAMARRLPVPGWPPSDEDTPW